MPDGSRSSGRTATPPATGWCRRRSPCPCRPGPKAEGAALQLANKMGIEPAMVVHSHGIGDGYTFFVVYGSVQHLVDLDAVARRGARLPAAVVGGDQRRDQERLQPQARRPRRLHRHRRAHRRHRRDPQREGLRGGEGPGVPTRDGRDQPRRAGHRARAGGAGPRRARPTPSWSPRWSPRRTRTCATPASWPPPSARRWGSPARCWSSAAPASTRRWPPTSASTRSSAGGRRPARSPATSSHALVPEGGRSMTDPRARPDRHPPPLRALRARPLRRRTWSTAPTRLGLFGDVATEVAIRDGRRRGAARRLLRGPLPRAGAGRRRAGGHRRGGPHRPAQPRAALHGPGGRPRRARARARRRPGCSTSRSPWSRPPPPSSSRPTGADASTCRPGRMSHGDGRPLVTYRRRVPRALVSYSRCSSIREHRRVLPPDRAVRRPRPVAGAAGAGGDAVAGECGPAAIPAEPAVGSASSDNGRSRSPPATGRPARRCGAPSGATAGADPVRDTAGSRARRRTGMGCWVRTAAAPQRSGPRSVRRGAARRPGPRPGTVREAVRAGRCRRAGGRHPAAGRSTRRAPRPARRRRWPWRTAARRRRRSGCWSSRSPATTCPPSPCSARPRWRSPSAASGPGPASGSAWSFGPGLLRAAAVLDRHLRRPAPVAGARRSGRRCTWRCWAAPPR